METFLSQFIFGVQRGIIYALIALAYTMVYGVVRIINFAYGEIFMIGAFISFFLVNLLPLPPGLNILMAFLVPMLICSLLGVAMDAVAYRPLRNKPRLATLITALGISFFLGNLVSYISAESVRLVAIFTFATALLIILYSLSRKFLNFPKKKVGWQPSFIPAIIAIVSLLAVGIILWLSKPVLMEMRWKGSNFSAYPVDKLIKAVKYPLFGSVYITNIQIMNIIIAVVLMIGLSILVNKTMIGLAMRASKNNKEAVYLMGTNVNRVVAITFLIGGALAGAAGVLSGITYPRLTAFMGIQPGLKGFIAAVLGSIGSIKGAMVGGVIMGLAEQFAIGLLPSDFGPQHIDFTPLSEVVAFAILIIVLLVRPRGIFGKSPRGKI